MNPVTLSSKSSISLSLSVSVISQLETTANRESVQQLSASVSVSLVVPLYILFGEASE